MFGARLSFGKSKVSGKKGRSVTKPHRAFVERLEERRLLSVAPNYMIVDSAAPGAMDDANADTHTLYEAISYANAHSEIADIYFADGLDEVTLDAALPTITGNYDLDGSTIKGADGAEDSVRDGGVTIRRDSENAEQFRILRISGGTAEDNVELIGLTITGGRKEEGGGICSRGAVTITNSTISGNTASWGGGINHLGSGTLTVTNSTISGNSASFGGGIYNY